jgi:hypothetical protein
MFVEGSICGDGIALGVLVLLDVVGATVGVNGLQMLLVDPPQTTLGTGFIVAPV